MAERSMKYPRWMRHPNYRPAVISDDYAQHGSQARTPLGHGAAPGRAAQFTPVMVHDEDTEAYYAAKGYEPTSAQGAVPPPPIVQPGDYVEFPKWVDGPNGPVVVHDAEEEARVTGQQPQAGPSEAELAAELAAAEAKVAALRAALAGADAGEAEKLPHPQEPDERSLLLARAQELGVAVDRRWGMARLRAALAPAIAAE